MLLKKIQSEENLFQVHKSFQTEERSKTGRKRKKLHLQGCLRRLGKHSLLPRAPMYLLHAPSCEMNADFAYFPSSIGAKSPFSSLKP